MLNRYDHIDQCFHLPHNVYLKASNGTILDCNNQQAAAVHASDPATLIGKKFFDLELNPYHKNKMNLIVRNDQEVIFSKKPKIFIEEAYNQYGSCYYLSYKHPFTTACKKQTNILGLSIALNKNNISSALSIANQSSILRFKKMFANYEHHLSNYEIICLYHLLYAEEDIIAKELFLSERTVEYYIAKLNDLFETHNNIELSMKVLTTIL